MVGLPVSDIRSDLPSIFSRSREKTPDTGLAPTKKHMFDLKYTKKIELHLCPSDGYYMLIVRTMLIIGTKHD